MTGTHLAFRIEVMANGAPGIGLEVACAHRPVALDGRVLKLRMLVFCPPVFLGVLVELKEHRHKRICKDKHASERFISIMLSHIVN